ncbi:hypothetical protein EC844_10777 [Acinetobacter calcoaceticus]|uniref:CENP-V/GFA domain-containing protein n=1 Tax=Acinetobacter calcoaceticus TaxID=471 RepID=A0A4R1Y6K5_ACICA|nr:hypothetical protein EC844_10777 [Acinetobacter calcoaceticus]
MKGQCVCGATQFELALKNHQVGSCHCSICRRQTSGVIMTIEIEAQSLKFSQQQDLAIYDSSAWGERGFCRQCGTNLFWRSKDHSYCNINVFALDEQPADLELGMEIFIDNKPDFYAFAGERNTMTEAEVMALFAAQSDSPTTD